MKKGQAVTHNTIDRFERGVVVHVSTHPNNMQVVKGTPIHVHWNVEPTRGDKYRKRNLKRIDGYYSESELTVLKN